MDDFLIIGGGIAGISAAARLAELGSVTVLEAEDALGYHTSGRSAAMFEENYGSVSTVALNRASKRYLETEDGGVLSPRGLLLVGSSCNETAFEADMKSLGLDEISVDDALKLVPILDPSAVTRAAYHDAARDIDTDLLLQNFARTARRAGTQIMTGACVTGIARDTGGWTVVTTHGDHGGRILINAAGAWADHVAAMAGIAPVGLTPFRRSVARIPAPAGYDVSNWPMLFGPGETWYAKPDAGKLLVSPADEDPTEPHDAWADDMVLATGIARFEAVVTETVTRMESNWAGLRTFAPDRCLVIGHDCAEPGFFWLAGQGGCGMQSAPAASRLVADLIGGRTPEIAADVVAALSPRRFNGAPSISDSA